MKLFGKSDNKKPQKQVKYVSGELGIVEKGKRGMIYSTDGKIIFTSEIVDLKNKTEHGIDIETLNSVYKVSYPQGCKAQRVS